MQRPVPSGPARPTVIASEENENASPLTPPAAFLFVSERKKLQKP